MDNTSSKSDYKNQVEKKRRFRAIKNYFATVFTWTLFVILSIIAALLVVYFVSIKIAASKGENPLYSVYTIVSPSMVPNVKVYDVVINQRVESPTEIKVGDIITFISTSSISKGMTITHRVMEINKVDGKYQYVTKGDNNIAEDSAPALYENVIGVAKLKLPQFGRLQFFVSSKYGWLVVVIIPALIIIIKDVIKIIAINNAKKDAKTNTKRKREENEDK